MKGVINSPGENVKALIFLVHGLGEHTGRYDSLDKGLLIERDRSWLRSIFPVTENLTAEEAI
ncbi:MAG: lysophospholipase [Marinilabiliales bacterium]|nr:lysophospholipase [Marinilabiliales bacterium]